MAKKVLLMAVLTVNLILTQAQYPYALNTDSILALHKQIISNLTGSFLDSPDSYINGKLYLTRGNNDNHPFFLVNSWKSGSVKYKGELFPLSMMKYDIDNDVLIILKIMDNTVFPVQLNKSVIREFTIEGHNFNYIDKIRNAGYYEKLYSAKTTIWAKWTKRSKVDANSVSGIPIYIADLHFIVQHNNNYFKVKNMKEIHNVFSDRKQELKSFERVNNLSFKKDKTGTLIKIARQYDLLIH